MKKSYTAILFFLFSLLPVFSHNLTEQEAESFIRSLISDSNEIIKYIATSQLECANRLGITYNNVNNKCLISIDIEPEIKQSLLKKELTYSYTIEDLEPGYSKLILEITGQETKYEYIFHNDKMISKPSYYSKDWETIISKYFIFHCSNKTLTNDYTVNRLDEFVDSMLARLECSETEIQTLQKEKIHYILCSDENEISTMTGYTARGLYYLADDAIISNFNCHYHEISHLLINYKLRNIDLYTLPVLQEGFAVAFGGRGGKEPEVILDMGRFLQASSFLDYEMLFTKADFFQYDASMSYPVSGSYVKYLINSIGMEKFLKLYTQYSGTVEEVSHMKFNDSGLFDTADWQQFIDQGVASQFLNVTGIDESNFQNIVIESDGVNIYENDSTYLVKLKSTTGYNDKEVFPDYQSKLFAELFPDNEYKGEKYILMADSNEVSIYNLLNNNLMAKYSVGFSMDNKPVMEKDGYYIFTVSKNLFDESLRPEGFININN